MSTAGGRVVRMLSVVFLAAFLAEVRGLPLRKQRHSSPKERSYKLVEHYSEKGVCVAFHEILSLI